MRRFEALGRAPFDMLRVCASLRGEWVVVDFNRDPLRRQDRIGRVGFFGLGMEYGVSGEW